MAVYFLCTFRAGAVAERYVGMGLKINLQPVPIPLVIPYFLAGRTDGYTPLEGLDFGQGLFQGPVQSDDFCHKHHNDHENGQGGQNLSPVFFYNIPEGKGPKRLIGTRIQPVKPHMGMNLDFIEGNR